MDVGICGIVCLQFYNLNPKALKDKVSQDLLVLAAFAALRVGLFGRYGRREWDFSDSSSFLVHLCPPPKYALHGKRYCFHFVKLSFAIDTHVLEAGFVD